MQPKLVVTQTPTAELVPYAGNAKEHPDWQIDQIAASIDQFGFADPVGIWHGPDGQPVIVEGHGRVLAAKRLGIASVPTVALDHLDDEGRRAYTLAHNKLTTNTGYDEDTLAAELDAITGIDMEQFGFDIDEALDFLEDLEHVNEDEIPEAPATRCNPGEIWQLGRHRLMCGDSTDRRSIDRLIGGNEVDLLLTDPPYNVDVGNCERPNSSNNGVHIMNDKMESPDFIRFLTAAIVNADAHLRAGGRFTCSMLDYIMRSSPAPLRTCQA